MGKVILVSPVGDFVKNDIVVKQIVFKETVSASTGVRLEESSLVSGEITQVTPHWPGGTNALVDIAFGHEQTWLCPSTPYTYLALDNATPVFTFKNEKIRRGDILWVIIRNRDGSNPHTVSVIVTTEGVERLVEQL